MFLPELIVIIFYKFRFFKSYRAGTDNNLMAANGFLLHSKYGVFRIERKKCLNFPEESCIRLKNKLSKYHVLKKKTTKILTRTSKNTIPVSESYKLSFDVMCLWDLCGLLFEQTVVKKN